MIEKFVKYFKENKTLFFILSLAALLRILWICLLSPLPVNDAEIYYHLALSLLHHNLFGLENLPTGHFLPAYPAFIAIVFKCFGENVETVYFIQAALAVATNYLIYKISISLNHPKRQALVAIFIYAVYLNCISYCSILITETFFTFLFLLSVLLALKIYHHSYSKINVILFSIISGFALLVKPQVIVFFLILYVFYFFKREKVLKTLILFSALTILPFFWMLRNYNVIGSFTIATNRWENLYIGNNPGATGSYMKPDVCRELTDKTEQGKCFKAEVLHFFKTIKPGYISLLYKKVRAQYRYETDGINWNEMALPQKNWKVWKQISQVSYLIVILLCVVSFLLHIFRRIKIDFLVYAAIVSFGIIGLVYFGDSRFHFPSIPFFCILSSFGINYFLCKLRPKWKI